VEKRFFCVDSIYVGGERKEKKTSNMTNEMRLEKE